MKNLVHDYINQHHPTYEAPMPRTKLREQNETAEEREQYGNLSAFNPSPTDSDPDRTQQEFRKETDTGEILKRHARGELIPQRQPIYGLHDGDMTLLTALEAVRQSQAAYNRLPDSVRQKWGTWEEVLRAAERGEIAMKDGKLQYVQPPPEQKPLDNADTK